MNEEKIKKFKNLLINEKNNILKTIDALNENTKDNSIKEYTNELSVYDNHPADIGTETYLTEHDMNLKDNEIEILDKIEKALSRIESNTYGICSKCGNDIELKRLEILPYATECSKCISKEIVTDEMNMFRPLEEDSLKFPFGRTNKDYDESDFVGIDGEDIYQEIENFNKINNDQSLGTSDNIGVFDKLEKGIVEEVDKITNEYYNRQKE